MTVLESIDWQSVDRQHFVFNEPGDTFVGNLVNVHQIEGRYGTTTAIDVTEIIEHINGGIDYGHQYRIYGTAVLIRKIQTVNLNHVVKIVYLGVDDNNVKQWSVYDGGPTVVLFGGD